MNSADFTSDQIAKAQQAVRTRASFFKSLAARMATKGFSEDDEILVATNEIREKMEGPRAFCSITSSMVPAAP